MCAPGRTTGLRRERAYGRRVPVPAASAGARGAARWLAADRCGNSRRRRPPRRKAPVEPARRSIAGRVSRIDRAVRRIGRRAVEARATRYPAACARALVDLRSDARAMAHDQARARRRPRNDRSVQRRQPDRVECVAEPPRRSPGALGRPAAGAPQERPPTPRRSRWRTSLRRATRRSKRGRSLPGCPGIRAHSPHGRPRSPPISRRAPWRAWNDSCHKPGPMATRRGGGRWSRTWSACWRCARTSKTSTSR